MRYLTLSEVLELHRRVMEQSGGAVGILNLSALQQERIVLEVASGKLSRAEFAVWLGAHAGQKA